MFWCVNLAIKHTDFVHKTKSLTYNITL